VEPPGSNGPWSRSPPESIRASAAYRRSRRCRRSSSGSAIAGTRSRTT
jgi:hypothetical protein